MTSVAGCPKSTNPAGTVIGAVRPSSSDPVTDSVVPPTHASAYAVVPGVIVYSGPATVKLQLGGAIGLAQVESNNPVHVTDTVSPIGNSIPGSIVTVLLSFMN